MQKTSRQQPQSRRCNSSVNKLLPVRASSSLLSCLSVREQVWLCESVCLSFSTCSLVVARAKCRWANKRKTSGCLDLIWSSEYMNLLTGKLTKRTCGRRTGWVAFVNRKGNYGVTKIKHLSHTCPPYCDDIFQIATMPMQFEVFVFSSILPSDVKECVCQHLKYFAISSASLLEWLKLREALFSKWLSVSKTTTACHRRFILHIHD